MKNNKYFSHRELACKSTGVVRLAPHFLDELIALREEYAKPMPVSSCCRSEAHNKHIGGHPRSLHVYNTPYHPTNGTCAIDITVSNGFDKADIVRIALNRGWGVEVAKNFVHLDRRDFAGLPQTIYPY